MFSLTSVPRWVRKLQPSELIWDFEIESVKDVYLTFDDGPTPDVTPFVLDCLKAYEAKATFFCIGKNVIEQPELYDRILQEGHRIGNHTQDHLNGWKTSAKEYLKNVSEAEKYINSTLFRPPYGRIKRSQVKKLLQHQPDFKIIMWSVLSRDYEQDLSPEDTLENVIFNIKPGAVVVFHDSVKAQKNMKYALPRTLEHIKNHNWNAVSIS